MKKIILLGFLLSNFIGLAQDTLIPDVNFEKALISQGIDSGLPDGKVLTSSVNGLKVLNINSSGITDLTGIQDFVNLLGLTCSFNQLSKLDISKNILLQSLDCDYNKLTALDLSNTKDLQFIDCGVNLLSNLDLSKQVNLTNLYCYSNPLKILDITKNIELLLLFCTSNQLSKLDVSKNTKLRSFSCSNNLITDLDLSDNKSLESISCNLNQLKTLNLKNTNNTKLTSVDFTNNPNLKCIQVDNKSYSDTNWSTKKDATASFSNNCNKIAITPPKITATANQTYCGSSLKIIPSVAITFDPLQPDTEAVYIQISSGYVFGNDVLTLANPSLHLNKNIVPSWDAATGKLKLSSPTGSNIPYSDFEAALKDIVFSNNQPVPSGTRSFSISIGSANYLPSTQHYYQYIPSLGISWQDAKLAAESSSYFGLKGYLATVMAADEAQLTGKQSSGAGWIGGSDAATEGVWRWVTGPEGLANGGTGIVFWNGGVVGTTPNFAFWNTNEPNQFGSREEDYVHITDPTVGNPGSWNDLVLNGDPTGFSQPKGYIVEYGGMPGDNPILQISASTSLTIPSKVDFEPASRCFTGTLTLKPKNFTGNIRWYNASTGGTLLTIANTYSPNISTTTSYWVDTTNGACPLSITNPRIEVIAKVITPSIVSAIAPSPICENTTVNLDATGSTASTINWYDKASGGTSLQLGTSFTTPKVPKNTFFYVDATESSCISSRTPIAVNVIKYPTFISTTPATRCDDGTLILDATASAGTLNWYSAQTGGSFLGTGSPFTTPSVSKTTNFYVDATDAGCTSPRTAVEASVYVIDKKNQEIVLCQTKTATLDASIPGLDYLWSPGGETTQTISVSSIGNYEVDISSPIASSCGSKKIFNVIEHPMPNIKEITVNDNSITIQLTDPKDYYEFSIDGVLFQKSNEFNYIRSGAQVAYVQENNSCNLISLPFTIFSIAKYFTPNNDGINDTWLIPEMKDYLGSNVKIFNRYGKLLKQLNTGVIGWNGQFNGENLIADDYWYVLKLNPNQPEIKGHFTLKR